MHGFGYALADGTYANPFYGAHFAKPGTYAFFSDPANKQHERTGGDLQRRHRALAFADRLPIQTLPPGGRRRVAATRLSTQ